MTYSRQSSFQIIGGGIVGLCTAYALLRAGVKSVRVLEQADAVASGTSFANAGMAHASLAGPWNRPGIGGKLLQSLIFRNHSIKISPQALWSLGGWGPQFLKHAAPDLYQKASRINYDLAAYSLALNHVWRSELNTNDDYQGQGLLKLYRSKQSFERAKQNAIFLQSLGLDTRAVSTADLPNFEPALGPSANQMTGGLYFKDDFKADTYQFAKALEQAITQKGGEILTSRTVTDFVIAKHKNGRSHIEGVLCGGQEYRADLTILCAGAKSYGLARKIGQTIQIRPIKGYSLSFDKTVLRSPTPDEGASNDEVMTPFPKIPVVDDDLHTAITPLGGGLRIAGLAEISGFNSGQSTRRLTPLLSMLKSLYPQFSTTLTLDQATIWHGFRPVSADGVPYIGMGDMAGIAFNTGHGHMGWTQSVGAAQLLSDICLSNTQSLDAGNYAVCRH